jgi:hypothetical protein
MSRPSEKVLALTLAWFPTAMPQGPAIGNPEVITWSNFCGVLWHRRHGPKDGVGFVAARFKLEDDGKHVRRLKANVRARTAIAMDVETSKATGELPPALEELGKRIIDQGLAAAIWTSHNHREPADIRYRVVLPLSAEIDHTLPAVEIIAKDLGIDGVLDRSKLGAASYFYLPSCSGDDDADLHQEIILPGAALDAHVVTVRAQTLQAKRDAEAERAAVIAHNEAEERRQQRIAAGFDPEDSLIEQIRPRLGTLTQILRDHGYDQRGYGNVATFRHPDSQSGSFGASVKMLGGIERVYSHNAGDPLHAGNLPPWCTVTAIDAFDTTVILDFGGDRKRALRELAERFGLSKREENRAVARLIHQLIRSQASQETIEACAYAEGARLGLSQDEVIRVAVWIHAKLQHGKEAA